MNGALVASYQEWIWSNDRQFIPKKKKTTLSFWGSWRTLSKSYLQKVGSWDCWVMSLSKAGKGFLLKKTKKTHIYDCHYSLKKGGFWNIKFALLANPDNNSSTKLPNRCRSGAIELCQVSFIVIGIRDFFSFWPVACFGFLKMIEEMALCCSSLLVLVGWLSKMLFIKEGVSGLKIFSSAPWLLAKLSLY